MITSLPLGVADVLALAFFLCVWVVFSLAAEGRIVRRISLTQAMNAQREAWMQTMARRELRMIDTGIMAGLQQGTAFFASSALVAVGSCFALLGATDQVISVLSDLPFIAPARGVFETKTIGLIGLFAYAFFKFGWAYRLFNYCSILIGAVPVLRDGATQPARDHDRGQARGAHEHPGGQAFQRGAARRVLLDQLSRLVRRPACARAVDAAPGHRAGAAAILLGGAPGADRSASFRSRKRPIDPAGQPVSDQSHPFAERDRRLLQRIDGIVEEQPDALPRPTCGNRPATAERRNPPFGTAPSRAACGRPRSPAAMSGRPRARQTPGEHRVLIGVAGPVFQNQPIGRNAERRQQARRGRAIALAFKDIVPMPPLTTTRASGKRRARIAAST